MYNAEASRRCMDIDHRRAHACAMENIHIHIGIYRLLILDSNLKFTRFQNVKKERRVNAFHYVLPRLIGLPLV